MKFLNEENFIQGKKEKKPLSPEFHPIEKKGKCFNFVQNFN